MKHKLIFIITLTICLCPLFSQTYSDYYSLHISPKRYMTWNQYSAFRTVEDTLCDSNGVSYLHYTSGKYMSLSLPLKLNKSQRILLPKLDCHNGEIVIRYGNKDINYAKLSVSLYDKAMRLINRNFISLSVSADTASIYFPLEKADVLVLDIDIAEVSNNNSGFDIYGIEIYIDGRNIDSFPLNMGAYDELSKLKIEKGLPYIPDKRILGIGENMHGTSTLSRMGIEIIKDRILNHNCRLVLLERSPEYIISLNHFANDTSYLKRGDVNDIINIIGSDWFDFLCWVRDFNMKSERKVVVAGIDNIDMMHDDFKYLMYIMSCKFREDCFDDILSCITDEDLLEALGDDARVWKYFSEYERFIIKHTIYQDIEALKKGYRVLQRDSLMAENIELFLDKFCKDDESVVIYAHYGHTEKNGYLNLIRNNSMVFGKVLSDKYGDDYYSLGLWAMDGRRSYFNDGLAMYKAFNASEYPVECLEHRLRHLDYVFYIPVETFPDGMVLAGMSGNKPLNYDYSFVNFRRSVDGIIFIPNVEAEEINKDVLRKHEERMDFILKYGMNKLRDKVNKKPVN